MLFWASRFAVICYSSNTKPIPISHSLCGQASLPAHQSTVSNTDPGDSKEPCAAQLLQNELCDQNELEFRPRTNDLGPVGSLVGEVRWDREESVNTRPTRILVHRGPSYAAPQEARESWNSGQTPPAGKLTLAQAPLPKGRDTFS